MIRIAIVEDEDIFAETLQTYLKRYGQEENVSFDISRFRDGDEIVEQYGQGFDIILMDIQMRFMNGMEAAAYIRAMDEHVVILFITNRTDYAIKGYEVDALDYMVKPVEYFSFSQKIRRAITKINHNGRKYISVPAEGGVRKIEIDTILYVESRGHMLTYVTITGKRIEARGVMRDLEETLSEYGFFRSNKGYLVNMRHVEGMEDTCCIIGNEKLIVSRARRADFMAELTRFINERA